MHSGWRHGWGGGLFVNRVGAGALARPRFARTHPPPVGRGGRALPRHAAQIRARRVGAVPAVPAGRAATLPAEDSRGPIPSAAPDVLGRPRGRGRHTRPRVRIEGGG